METIPKKTKRLEHIMREKIIKILEGLAGEKERRRHRIQVIYYLVMSNLKTA